MMYQGKNRYPVTEVILHCAAVSTGFFDGWKPSEVISEIDRWHRQRGFAQIGYHGLFMPDGTFHKCRPSELIGAHCKEANRGTLGWLLLESRRITAKTRFYDWFTVEQDRALRRALETVQRGGIRRVSGHNDYAPRLCPGFDVGEWYRNAAPFPRSGDNFVTLNADG